MKKQILVMAVAAALSAGAYAQAAGSAEIDYGGSGTTRPDYGPQTNREIRGNSGYNPDRAYGYDDRARAYGYDNRRSSRHYRNRDRDGDGVIDRHDRYPDNRRRS